MSSHLRQVPSVGRIVLFYSASYNTALGAFVCSVAEPANPESALNLLVFDPDCALLPMLGVAYGPGQAGRWGWPIYVPSVLDVPSRNTGNV